MGEHVVLVIRTLGDSAAVAIVNRGAAAVTVSAGDLPDGPWRMVAGVGEIAANGEVTVPALGATVIATEEAR